MRALAEELGYAVTFPTSCRYCGRLIYLYAHPNGGFAIFDDLGPPWPLHDCWGIEGTSCRYSVMNPRFTREFRLPVPAVTAERSAQLGEIVVGTIVETSELSPNKITIYDGASLLKFWVTGAMRPGAVISGVVGARQGEPALEDIHAIEPPAQKGPRAAEAWSATGLQSLPDSDVWTLQEDEQAVRAQQPMVARLLVAALDAFLNGFRLVGICLLTEVVRTTSDALPAKLKARHARTVFRVLRELALEGSAPGLWEALSRGTRAALADSEVQGVVDAGRIRVKLEASGRLQQRLEDRLSREERYLAQVDGRVSGLRHAVARFRGLASLST
jgi:hypothetical protein